MNQNKDQQIKMLKNQFKLMLEERNFYIDELKKSEARRAEFRELIFTLKERLLNANLNWFYKLLTGKLWKKY